METALAIVGGLFVLGVFWSQATDVRGMSAWAVVAAWLVGVAVLAGLVLIA